MALTKIKTSGIADNAITNAKMADDAIDSADFADASIDNAHLADDAVNSDEIAAGAIDLAHMSVNSIDSDQYVDGSIDNVHLAGSIAVSKTLLAGGTGLTLSTNTLAVDAAQTQITSVGTLTALTGGTGDFNWDSNTLVVDSSASKVGIGTLTPATSLEIAGDFDASSSPSPSHTTSNKGILIAKEASGDYSIGDLYGIDFSTTNSAGSTNYNISAIYAEPTSSPYFNAGALHFLTNSGSNGTTLVKRMTINSSGNVGIGLTAPATKLQVESNETHTDNHFTTADKGIVVGSSTTLGEGLALWHRGDGSDVIGSLYDSAGVGLNFINRASSSGNAVVALSLVNGNAEFAGRLNVEGDGTSTWSSQVKSTNASPYVQKWLMTANVSDGSSMFLQCDSNNNANKFKIFSNGELWQESGGTTIDSDRKLKDNIVDASPKLGDINKLKVRNFNYKKTPDIKRIGFIAQEVEEIFPSLVKEYPNTTEIKDDEGNVVTPSEYAKGIQQVAFIPMLIKAVQELSDKVTALENA